MDVERLPSGVQDKVEPSSADDKKCNALNAIGIASPADLIRLLNCLESELQARDLFIVGLMKSQTSKQLLYQTKYGRLGLNDPFASLQRDSETCGEPDSAFDEVSVGKMYETQLGQLEKLIGVQRRAHLRAKQVLAAAEKRHARTVREWEEERQRRKFDAAQSDDVCMMLEKERERLKGELEVEKSEQERLKAELARLNRLISEEKERRKQIVLCLLQDRRKLAILFSEERTKVQALTKKIDKSDQCKNCLTNKNGSEEALKRLTLELENVKSLLKQEKEENASLKETLRCQESDLNLIRETILAKSKKINVKSANSAICNTEPMSCSEISGRSHDVKYSTNTISHKSHQLVHHDATTRKTSLPSPQHTPSVSPLLRYRPPVVNNTSLQQQRFPSPKFQSVPPPQKGFQNVAPPCINEQLLIASPRRSQSVRASLGPKLKSPTVAEGGHHPSAYSKNVGQTAGMALIGPGNLSTSQKVPASPAYPQQSCFPQSPFLEAIRGLFGQTTNIVTGIQSSLVDRLSNSTTELCVENNAALVRESEFSASGALDIGAAINEFDLNVNGQPVPSSAIPRFPHGPPNYVAVNHQPQNESFPTKSVNNQQQQCLVRPLCLKANLIGPKSSQMGSLPLSPAVTANSQLTKSLTACSSSMTSTAPSCRWQYNKQRQATACNKPAGGVVGLTVAGLANKVQQKVGHHLRQRSFDRSSFSTESACRSTRSTRVPSFSGHSNPIAGGTYYYSTLGQPQHSQQHLRLSQSYGNILNTRRFDEEMQSPRYTVEHLATFGYGPNFGLNSLSDGIRKLKHMELTHAIWAQRMILRLKRDAIVIEDENMEIVEAFPLNLVSEVTVYLSGDSSSSHDIYNKLLVFIVNENNAANNNNKTANKTQPAMVLSEMHIFQCVRISAEEVAEDVRQYMQGRFSNVPCGKRESNFDAGRLPPFPYYDQCPPGPIFPTNGHLVGNSMTHQPPVPVTNGQMQQNQHRRQTSSLSGERRSQTSPYYPRQQQQQPLNISMTNGAPTSFERDVNTLNRHFDDIERFVARIQQAATVQREIEANALAALNQAGKRRKGVKRFDSRHPLPLLPRQPPPLFPTELEFVDIFQKFKSCFNLLAKLKNHIHEPNAPELLHFLFTPFALILDACTWGIGRHLVSQIYAPALSSDAKILLENSLTSREKEVWISLGDAWTNLSNSHSAQSNAFVVNGKVNSPTTAPPRIGYLSSPLNSKQAQFLDRLKLRGSGTKIAIVTYDRTGQNQKELTVTKSEYLEILDDSKKWWECRNAFDQTGYVPHTILKVLTNQDSSLENDGIITNKIGAYQNGLSNGGSKITYRILTVLT